MTLKISEADLATFVEDLLERFHWRWIHMRPARVSRGGRDVYETAYAGKKGYPDYTIVSDGEYRMDNRLIFAELKSEDGKMGEGQEEWLRDLKECVRTITFEPINIKGATPALMSLRGIPLVPSFEVYLWKPSDMDDIMEILR